MVLSAEDQETLINLLGVLTPGELSTVVAALREPHSQIGTSTDSKNFAFLHKLCELGLAREVPLAVDMPPDLEAVLRSILIDEDAKPQIASLISRLSGNHTPIP